MCGFLQTLAIAISPTGRSGGWVPQTRATPPSKSPEPRGGRAQAPLTDAPKTPSTNSKARLALGQTPGRAPWTPERAGMWATDPVPPACRLHVPPTPHEAPRKGLLGWSWATAGEATAGGATASPAGAPELSEPTRSWCWSDVARGRQSSYRTRFSTSPADPRHTSPDAARALTASRAPRRPREQAAGRLAVLLALRPAAVPLRAARVRRNTSVSEQVRTGERGLSPLAGVSSDGARGQGRQGAVGQASGIGGAGGGSTHLLPFHLSESRAQVPGRQRPRTSAAHEPEGTLV